MLILKLRQGKASSNRSFGMASVNKVVLIGHLGVDPENRAFSNGDAVCNIRLATSETWKDKTTGEKREATEWHRVVLYRKLAEIAGQYLRKGSQVYIEGRLRTRKWQDKDGTDRYTTEIEASEMKMLGVKAEYREDDKTKTSPISDVPWIDEVEKLTQSKPPRWLEDDGVPF